MANHRKKRRSSPILTGMRFLGDKAGDRLNEIDDSELDFGFAERKDTDAAAEDVSFADFDFRADETEEEDFAGAVSAELDAILGTAGIEPAADAGEDLFGFSFGDEEEEKGEAAADDELFSHENEESGSKEEDERFDIDISLTEFQDDELDFEELGAFIEEQPQAKPARKKSRFAVFHRRQDEDKSISFDEDETDDQPAVSAAKSDSDDSIPKEHIIVGGKVEEHEDHEDHEDIDSILKNLGIIFGEETEETAADEVRGEESVEQYTAETEATDETEETFEIEAESEQEDTSVNTEETDEAETADEADSTEEAETADETESEAEDSGYDDDMSAIDSLFSALGITFDEAEFAEAESAEDQYEEDFSEEYESAYSDESEADDTDEAADVDDDTETDSYEAADFEDEAAEEGTSYEADEEETGLDGAEDITDDDIDAILSGLGIKFDEDIDELGDTAAEADDYADENEADYAEDNSSEAETAAEEEPSGQQETEYGDAEDVSDNNLFSDAYFEEYDAAKVASEYYDERDYADEESASAAQAEAMRYARKLRENGFDFDALYEEEEREKVEAEDILNLGYDDEDETAFVSGVDMTTPVIGVTYGVEEEDKGLPEEHVVSRDEAPITPAKKPSLFGQITGLFSGRKKQEESGDTDEAAETDAETDAAAYDTDGAEHKGDAAEYTETETADYSEDGDSAASAAAAAAAAAVFTATAAEGDVMVEMAAGFSAAELADAHARKLEEEAGQKKKPARSFRNLRDRKKDDGDYDYRDPDGDDYLDDENYDDFPSFKEFVMQDIASIIFKFSSKGKVAASTVAEDEEPLGKEASAAFAMQYYGRFVHPLQTRLKISGVIIAIMLFMSLGILMPGMLKNTQIAAAGLMAMQFTVMLLALDVVTNAIMNGVRGKFGADTIAVIACLATSFDAVLVAKGIIAPHMPLCLLSSASVAGILFSDMLSAYALRKTTRVPAISRRVYVMTAENNLTDKGTITLLKSKREMNGFVRRAEEAAPDEWIYMTYGPYILIALTVIAFIITAITRDLSTFIYNFSAVVAPAVPFTALLCFAMPFFMSAVQLFSSGAAIAGWSGVNEMGRSREIVVTDRDLFPEDNVKIKDIRLFADVDEVKTVAYAGTIIVNSGSCLAPAFAQYMRTVGIAQLPVEGYEYLPGGGLKGIIESNVIILGNADMMRLMGIAVKNSLIKPNTIAIAVNNCLYGFIDVEYTPDDKVRDALIKLVASSRHPIFAVRDFNITPALIRDLYDVPTDGYDFPSYIERFRLSSAAPDKSSLPAAVLCTEGLAPLTRTANAGRAVYLSTKINMWINGICALIGIIAAAAQIITTGAVVMPFMAILSVLMALPVLLVSAFMKI